MSGCQSLGSITVDTLQVSLNPIGTIGNNCAKIFMLPLSTHCPSLASNGEIYEKVNSAEDADRLANIGDQRLQPSWQSALQIRWQALVPDQNHIIVSISAQEFSPIPTVHPTPCTEEKVEDLFRIHERTANRPLCSGWHFLGEKR
jgi:hypothetical protein